MCDWVGKSADLLEPLVKRMHKKILQSPKINTDDTRIPVKIKTRKGSTYNGYLWVYVDDNILITAIYGFMSMTIITLCLILRRPGREKGQ